MPGTRVDVDIVVPDSSIANGLEAWTLVQQLRVDPVAGLGLHAVLALKFCGQFIARIKTVLLVGLHFEMPAQKFDGFVEHFTRHKNLLLHLLFESFLVMPNARRRLTRSPCNGQEFRSIGRVYFSAQLRSSSRLPSNQPQ